jgi:hypothetical protein
MEPPDIVSAIGNLLKSGVPIANEIHVLNHSRAPAQEPGHSKEA